jgi:serine protease inhibitor
LLNGAAITEPIVLFSKAKASLTMTTQGIDNRLVTAINAFAFRVFSQIGKRNENRNIFISPLSLTFALALLHNGADGTTMQELAEILGIQNIGLDEANTAYAVLQGELEQRSRQVNLSIANSLWAQKGLTFRQDFIQSSQNFYSAEVFNLNFADSDALLVINDWVKHKTNGKINEIVRAGDLDANTILILLNAIYFKGIWRHQFSKSNTKEAPFILSEGQSKLHPMMSQSGTYEYFQSEEFQALSIPYGDSDISMIVFLPNEQNSLSNFLQRLDFQKFHEWRSQFSRMQGDLVLPRFTVDYEESLMDAFKTLGLNVALSDRANYQNMCDAFVFISDIRHKTFMEVNEEGTEASAATGVLMQRSISQKFSMVVNRPFFCAIQDHQTGLILFMGAIWEPS